MKAKRITGTGLLLSLFTSVGLVFGSISPLSTQARAQFLLGDGVSIDVEAIDPLRIGGYHDDDGLEWSYAAKFLCGFVRVGLGPNDAFVPGQYRTDLEILNTTTRRVSLQLAAGEAGGTTPTTLDGKRIWRTLQKDEGLQFDCVDILDFLGIGTVDSVFAKGWIVVRSKSKLHVTAVYMLETGNVP